MKHHLSFLFCFSVLIACKNGNRTSSDDSANKKETPKALQEQSSYSLSKSRSVDLVDDLYQEVVQKDSSLYTLEKSIENFNEGKYDSLLAFKAFDNKNQSYYVAANQHLSSLHDSALLKEIKTLIDQSSSQYQSAISETSSLIKNLDVKTASLEDLHTALKLIKTLPLIEKYQKYNKPSSKPIENVVKQADQLITREKEVLEK